MYTDDELKNARENTEYLFDSLRSSGLTRTSLAKALDIGPSAVTQMISGERPIAPHIKGICNFFGIEEQSLIGKVSKINWQYQKDKQ